jgi:fibronectin type 3 domain-containing protein
MATPRRAASPRRNLFLILFTASIMLSCGGSGSGGGGGNTNPPAAPTGLTATAGNASVSLTWTGSSGANSYNVKRSTTNGSGYATIGTSNVATYTDTTAANGTTYYYVVTAVNSNGESGDSNQASAMPTLPIPAAPTGLTATPGNATVMLSWTASSGAASYNVKRSTSSGSEVTISSPTGTSYNDSSVTNGTKYYYEVSAVNASGESANSNEVSATPSIAAPAAPTGLNAAPRNAQVALVWNTSTGATSYNVKRSTTNGSGYTTVSSPTGTSYNDTGLTNGTLYYYVVSAVGAGGESANSSQVSATPLGTITNVSATVNVLANRHPISPYIYGGAFPQDAPTITDSGLTTVRWGGNGASTYNWQLGTNNADNDYYFEDFTFGALNNSADASSTQFITDVKAAGGTPLTTMVMLPWVAQTPETSVTQGGTDNYHWTFSVSQDGACNAAGKVDQYNVDAGINLQSDCSTTMVASPTQLNRTYFPLLDDSTQTCPVGTCVYRKDWATALATAFGSGSCPIPNSSLTSCHFYDMDNEIDIWGGTHVDVHPNPTTYQELRDIFLTESRNLKGWDPAAVRLGPVSCCWYYYWRSATGASDTSSHGGVDFIPWWLNEVAWSDAVAGSRSLEIFDIHAYPDADTGGLTQAQLQVLDVSVYRDWWDPTYTSPAAYIRNDGFSNEPLEPMPFRIPRIRAVINSTYPGTQFSITEWSAAFTSGGDKDFSTALGDADAYGILGRERVALASRWTAPSPTNPNYLALKLFTNYDGSHHGFATTSISDTNTGNPSLFSSYAAVNSAGTQMTLLVLNKDPANTASVQFAFNGFTPTSVVSYTLASTTPTKITASSSGAWSATQSFAPYTATLLVITGTTATLPASSWDLNPDTTMVPASGTVILNPKIISGSTNVNLSSAVFDAYEGAAACSGSLSLTTSTITPSMPGEITVTAGSTPGFCHFTVTGSDGTATQTEGGWIVVGNPAATLAKTTGDGQTGTHGTALPTPLTVTLSAGSSGGTNTGASVLFTTNAGTLSNGTATGTKVIVVTNSSGVTPAVTLTLPSTTGTVTVTAEGPYGLGHPVATFSETSD